MRKLKIKNNENKEICSECGVCCRRFAGIIWPTQLENITEDVVRMVRSRLYSIDCWDADGEYEDTYWIRPAHTNATYIIDKSWGGTCVFLGENGCKLKFEDRPAQCQATTPKPKEIREKEGCETSPYTKEDALNIWIYYQDEILKAIEILENVT